VQPFTSVGDGRASVPRMSGKSVPPHVARYIREKLKERIRETKESQRELADRLKLSKGSITQIFGEGRGVGWTTAEGFMALMRIDEETLFRQAREFEAKNPAPPPPRRVGASWGDLPGWKAAEAEARRRFPHVPEDAWLAARRMSGATDPDVNASTVKAAAELYLTHMKPLATQPLEEPPEDAFSEATKAAARRRRGK
jgi:transcriptional regulator with XRE-family HTH domain